ncbi:MAG: hypothetical protein Kow0029_08430 [Candidatus Rifleibacteriota bacterium]
MSQYVALRLRKLPMIHWVIKPELEFDTMQDLVVRTQHGTEIAKVLRIADTMPESMSKDEEKFVLEVLRVVDEEDRKTIEDIKKKEREAFLQAREKIHEHQLNMKLLKAEFLFDMSRVIFYFKSETKVDFRELLKSLAAIFKTRIELRQIGVRDETKLLGGIGCCGKEVCCHQFMTTFYPVSTKMAKEQNLSLNPAKLSGICGRLLCCLAHEHEYYASFHGKFPKISSEVVVGEETGRVLDINYITRKILIGFADKRKTYYDLDVVHGRKDSVTGRNLWWIQKQDEDEPDLSILLRNLNPPGSGKKKKSGSAKKSADDRDDSGNQSDKQQKELDQMNADNDENTENHHPKERSIEEKNKKLSDSPTEKDNS